LVGFLAGEAFGSFARFVAEQNDAAGGEDGDGDGQAGREARGAE